MNEWYAIYTKPHKERQVTDYFSERGIEAYYPTTPVRARRGRSSERAFFPCYLFVNTDIQATGLWTLNYAPGVRRVVMIADHAMPIDERIIDAIRDRLARSNVVDMVGEILEPGDQVVITSGPFADLDAVFDQRLSPQGRVRVLVQLLARWAKVELDSDALRKTKSSKV
jgi:transcription elongation factor/antiterminator RfaH